MSDNDKDIRATAIKTPVTIEQTGREHKGTNKGYSIYDADGNAVTGWGQVLNTREKMQYVADALNAYESNQARLKAIDRMLAATNAIAFDEHSTLVRMLGGEWGVRTGNIGGTVLGKSLIEAYEKLIGGDRGDAG